MEHKIVFNTLTATYAKDESKGFLGGPYEKHIKTTIDGINFIIHISQTLKRTIEIRVADGHAVYWSKLIGPLYRIEQLLMIFDGEFVPLVDVAFSNDDDSSHFIIDEGYADDLKEVISNAHINDKDCAAAKGQMLHQRLKYYTTDDIFTSGDRLIGFDKVLTDAIFDNWVKLLYELDIVNQVYLYTISKNFMPVDMRLSFMTELAEPLVEIVNAEKNYFPSLKPGSRGTTLKQCLNVLINQYGRVIFQREMNSNYDFLLSTLVSSRVRVMHIKRDQPKEKYYDGIESIRYMKKLSLLYRVVLFDLLCIDEVSYKARLENATRLIDSWMV